MNNQRRSKSISAEQGLWIDVGLLHRAELQQLGGLEASDTSDQQVGKLLDAHVVQVHRLVGTQLAAIGDPVLRPPMRWGMELETR